MIYNRRAFLAAAKIKTQTVVTPFKPARKFFKSLMCAILILLKARWAQTRSQSTRGFFLPPTIGLMDHVYLLMNMATVSNLAQSKSDAIQTPGRLRGVVTHPSVTCHTVNITESICYSFQTKHEQHNILNKIQARLSGASDSGKRGLNFCL